MSLERDLQSKIAVRSGELLTMPAKDTPVYGETIDTIGFRNITFVIIDHDTLLDGSDPHVYFQDSPDGITWARVPETHVLPTRHYDANGQAIFDAIDPYYQTIGVFDADRYLRIVGVEIEAEQRSYSITYLTILEAENQQFDGYDPSGRPVDNLP